MFAWLNGLPGMPNLKALRALRALRALKALRFMNQVLQSSLSESAYTEHAYINSPMRPRHATQPCLCYCCVRESMIIVCSGFHDARVQVMAIVDSIEAAVPLLKNVAMLFAFFLLIYSIMGTQILAGAFRTR